MDLAATTRAATVLFVDGSAGATIATVTLFRMLCCQVGDSNDLVQLWCETPMRSVGEPSSRAWNIARPSTHIMASSKTAVMTVVRRFFMTRKLFYHFNSVGLIARFALKTMPR